MFYALAIHRCKLPAQSPVRPLLHDVKMTILHALHALEIIQKLGMIHTGIS
jgi:hypothetical protein